MRKLFVISTAFLFTFAAKAQAFEEGHHYINAGYGVGNLMQFTVKKFLKGTNKEYSGFGPIFFKYEYAVSKFVGFGLSFASARASGTADDTFTIGGTQVYNYKLTLNYKTWSALARLNFHFSQNEHFDPYIGLGIGYGSKRIGFEYNDPKTPRRYDLPNLLPFGIEMTFGVRYLVTPNIGFYAELGLAKAIIQGGLSVKI